MKTTWDESIWLVQQPDHGQLAGYLAAHWGGQNGFARPGEFAAATPVTPWQAALYRQEVVLAIAAHDNGWWEWEAVPPIDPSDHLPWHLTKVSQAEPGAGLDRWRLGVPRLAEKHPYLALLISLHAYWLYAFAFPENRHLDDAFRHPLFGIAAQADQGMPDPERVATLDFLDQQYSQQQNLQHQLQQDSNWQAAIVPEQLFPHARLLQTMDALSLLLSFGGQHNKTLADIPRLSWEDRVSLNWQVIGNQQILCEPFPFDTDPLPVYLPVRIMPRALAETEVNPDTALPLVRLHATPLQTVRFEIRSSSLI